MSFHLTEAFEDQVIRISGTPAAPLFCAPDVCAVLGLTNPTVALDALDDDERAKVSLGHRGETNYVTESGLYHLVFKSRKAAAKRFRRWVTETVLPEIRKNGSFHAPEAVAEARDLECVTLTRWLSGMGLDLRDDARRCAVLLHCVARAATSLRWHPSAAKSRHQGTLFQEVPRSVLDLAEGLYIQGTNGRMVVSEGAALPAPVEAQEVRPKPTQTGGTIREIMERRRREMAQAAEGGAA